MAHAVDRDTLRRLWLDEYHRPFSGWDFTYLAGRRTTIRPADTWDYTSTVVAAIRTARSMLDMDTGGGEFVASLPQRPPRTCATEAYPPNLPVARARLAPLGVRVYGVSAAAQLPFADGAFDLVTNRHGSYEAGELRRVLAAGGVFITQQVGDQTNRTLHDLLDDPGDAGTWNAGTKRGPGWNLAQATRELEEAGLQIIVGREEFPITRYADVGAIVYYLKAIPWEIPDFSVDRYFDKLVAIHAQIQARGPLDVLFHTFFIRARKP